jgi:hypothetical protein
MQTEGRFGIRRLRGSRRETTSLSTPPAAETGSVFTCSSCRREFPVSDGSRVARGRCRACA